MILSLTKETSDMVLISVGSIEFYLLHPTFASTSGLCSVIPDIFWHSSPLRSSEICWFHKFFRLALITPLQGRMLSMCCTRFWHSSIQFLSFPLQIFRSSGLSSICSKFYIQFCLFLHGPITIDRVHQWASQTFLDWAMSYRQFPPLMAVTQLVQSFVLTQ